MQVIEVCVCNQHQVNRRKIAHPEARLPQPLQDEKPSRKVGIDHNILPPNLQEETGMSDECHSHLVMGGELGLMGVAGPGSHGGTPHQAAELAGAVAESAILNRLQH